MTKSMTGYARAEENNELGVLSVELRSVNQRFLDLNFRMPEAFRPLESEYRRVIGKAISRGKMDVNIQFRANAAVSDQLVVNQSMLAAVQDGMNQVQQTFLATREPTALEIMRWPGVLQDNELDMAPIVERSKALVKEAIAQMLLRREEEGERLKEALLSRCEKISEHVVQVRALMPQISQALREKIVSKIEAAMPEYDEGRLEQELVIHAQKMDVDEELDRLDSHMVAIQDALKSKEPVGRRLDFLMQECTREANTLGSKSQAIDTTDAAVELKVIIEQMREQVQNIE